MNAKKRIIISLILIIIGSLCLGLSTNEYYTTKIAMSNFTSFFLIAIAINLVLGVKE